MYTPHSISFLALYTLLTMACTPDSASNTAAAGRTAAGTSGGQTGASDTIGGRQTRLDEAAGRTAAGTTASTRLAGASGENRIGGAMSQGAGNVEQDNRGGISDQSAGGSNATSLAGVPNQNNGGIAGQTSTAGMAAINVGGSSAGSTASAGTAGQTTAGQTTAGQTTAGQTTAGQTTAGQTTTGQTTAGQTTAGQTTAGQTTAGQPDTAGQTTAGQTTAGQPDTAGDNVASQGGAAGGRNGSGGHTGTGSDQGGEVGLPGGAQMPLGGQRNAVPACAHPRSSCGRPGLNPCGPDQRCQPLPVADGPCICVDTMPVAPKYPCGELFDGYGRDGCCEDEECGENAVCMRSAHGVNGSYCGGAPPPEENRCYSDRCTTNEDCRATEVCVPKGAFNFKYSRCVPASCRRDTDCNTRAGGACRAFITRCSTQGYSCHYDDDPCRLDSDCPRDQFEQVCRVRNDRDGTLCEPYFPPG
ncbi:MAG: hypothetical protein VX589_19055 [Myxococcota bacterium]|nr:hypothetical protein [Myxococcota bacterium]